MAQVIVNPRLMVAFSGELERLVSEMRQWESKLNEGLESLNTTWDDQRYLRFKRAVTTASVQLQIFYNRGNNYCEYLRRKAAAAERYLGH